MSITIKRIYDTPEKKDGTRVLIDRLWPRGLKKESAQIDEWMKELAPSPDLRKWFHTDPTARQKEFSKKYKEELRSKKAELKELRVLATKKRVTLLTATRDLKHSYLTVLSDMLHGKA